MLYTKYKILRSTRTLFNLEYIFKENFFIGFFQLKSLSFENIIQIKQLTFTLNMKVFFCKNTLIKKNKFLPLLFLPSLSQGCLVIIYSRVLSMFDSINLILNKTKLFSLFFYIENKLTFLKKLYLLSKTSRMDFFVQFIHLLDNYNKNMLSLFVASNYRFQFLSNIL
uniref:Ribosomal protein S10 (Orf166) n=1 Tax=Cryptomonas curvata TaxID=233186 RepID=A0A2P1G8F7_9CRYP|nr:ribosomal protein S10 (orf166) [Cryptomonas curvata]AVM81247.1 ribosomal protein S10 (orf166) [Cryptomonas curvata]